MKRHCRSNRNHATRHSGTIALSCQCTAILFILSVVAGFDIEGITYRVSATEGIQIRAGQAHRIVNDGDTSLEFLLASRPSTADDRHFLYSDTNTLTA